jgi:predicted anti-sigma-YlaC factor YlaD
MMDCDHCEKVLQPYLDRVLSEEERLEAELHLTECSWCAKRYRFEANLRQIVKTSVAYEMPPHFVEKLSALRPGTPLI